MSEFTRKIAGFSQARLALLCAELQDKLDSNEAAATEPIAIVGMACRFPGQADDPESFWRLLEGGVDAVTDTPSDRWDVDAFFDPDPQAPGKMYCRRGAYLDEVDTFDPQFFNISPREAVSLDPQHRLLLEVTWEALENAGQNPLELRGSLTGVFVGIGADDYAKLQVRSGTPESVTAYTGTGNAYCYGAGRLSFFLGAQGPSFPIDTACSSSLVAVHLASRSLRARECNLAVVGGVHLMLSPIGSIFLSKARALAPDGRCKTFDAGADGYVRGEGCGVVILKRLSDALASRDRIHAVIRGSAVNHDGPSSGFTVPNGQAQQAVIRAALSAARVAPRDVSYVEVHGTGTALGDPIELRALAAVLGRAAGRPSDRPLTVGSVKTNIGHLEPAAGIAGLIKVVLALQKDAIPAHLHLQQLNPHIDLDAGPFTIPTVLTAWPRGNEPRVAAISSFGLSGTNAHVLLEEAPPVARPEAAPERPLHLFTLSAKDDGALRQLADRYAQSLEGSHRERLADVCYTANTGRADFSHRLAIATASLETLGKALAAVASGQTPAEVRRAEVHGRRPPKVAFLFTGQGSQYVGMARTLYETQPTFQRTLDHCAERLDPVLPAPLLSVLYSSDGDGEASALLDQTAYAPPALFAIEYALAELWRSWGVEPAVVLGHGVGEYVAACVAGVFSLDDGLALVAARGQLMQLLPRGGAMLAVSAGVSQLGPMLSAYAGKVSIAAYNAPDRIVVSGTEQALGDLSRELEGQGIATSRLAVSHAFHSPLMDPILDAFEEKVAAARLSPPRLRLVSNLTGARVEDEVTQPSYWRRHLREAVLFAQGIRTARELGCTVFLEVGPKPVLIGMGKRGIGGDETTWLPSLGRGRDWEEMLNSAAVLYVHGVGVSGAGLDRDYTRTRVALPTYPFQRDRYWVDLAPPPPKEPLVISEADARDDPELGPALAAMVKACGDDGVMTINRRVTARLVFFTATREAAFFLNQKSSSIVVSIYLGPEDGFEAAFRELERYAAARELDLTIFAKEDKAPLLQTLGFSTTPVGVWQSLDDLRSFTLKGGSAKTLRSKVNSYRNLGDVSATEYVAGSDPSVDDAIVALMNDWIARKGKKAPFESMLKDEIVSGTLDRSYRLFIVRRAADIDAVILLSPVAAKNGWVMDLEFYRSKMPSGALEFGIVTILETLKAESVYYYSLGATFGTQLGPHPNEDPKVQGLLQVFHDRNILNGDGNFVFKSKFSPSATRFYVCRRHDSSSDTLPDVLAMLADPGTEMPVTEGHSGDAARATRPRTDGAARRPGALRTGSGRHLVGERLALATSDAVFEIDLRLDTDLRFVRDHRIFGNTVLPATAYLDAISGAARSALGACAGLSDIVLQEALVVREENAPTLQVVVSPDGPDRGTVRVCSARPGSAGAAWTTHATATVLLSAPVSPPRERAADLAAAQERCTQTIARKDFYDQLRVLGIEYGASFQAVEEVWTAFGEAIGRVRLPATVPESGFDLHPVLLDGCLQVHAAALLASQGEHAQSTYVPVRIESLRLYAPLGRQLWSHVRLHAVEGERPETITADLTLFSAGGVVAAELDGFTVRRTSAEVVRRLAPPPTGLFYELEWLAKEHGANRARGPTPGRWLIFADAGGLGARLAERLEHEGQKCLVVRVDTASSQGGTLEPHEQTAAALAAAQVSAPGVPLSGVVHLWGADLPAAAARTVASLRRAQSIGSYSVLQVVQALAVASAGARVWIVTRGVNAVAPPADVAPEHAAAWGLGRTIAQEHPEVWGGLIDLGHDGAASDADLVLTEILYPDGEDHIVLRAGRRSVARLRPADLRSTAAPIPIRSDGTHLITGGLGGLGGAVARSMVQRGARHLALIGRQGLAAPGAAETVEGLRTAGAHVTVLQTDVSREEDVARALDEIARSMPPLCGVVHAAGVLADGTLLQQTRERFDAVMAPKLNGAWNLHALTGGAALDYFVVFSSTASLIGAAGQGNYAAANAFMDALVHHRRAQGQVGVSVNWGPWSELGMSARAGAASETLRAAHGIGALKPAQAIDAFEKVLNSGHAQVGVVSVDWKRLLGSSSIVPRSSLFRDLARVDDPSEADARVLAMLLGVSVESRREAIERYLCEQVGSVLHLDPTKVPREEPLTVMGFDSLLALELRERVERDLHVTVPVVNLFRGDNVVEFAAYLLGELRKRHPDAFAGHAAVPGPEQLLADVDDLSDEAVDALLKDVIAEGAR